MGAMAVKVDASKMWFEQEETEGTERGFFWEEEPGMGAG
jgi:hypothetical protein